MATISTRDTILDQLKSDFKKIKVTRGYNTIVADVKRGIFMPEDCTMRPAIVFTNTNSEKVVEAMGVTRRRHLHLVVWAFIDIHPGDYEALDGMVGDVEKFLESSDNTNHLDTYVGDIGLYEGGEVDPIGIAEIEVVIQYDYNISNP